MKKALVTILTKKENCGHAILDKVCLGLDIQNPATSKQVKTADLYLLNINFKKTFDNILEVARAELTKMETQEDIKDIKTILSELKNQTEIVNEYSIKFNKAYRQTATAEKGIEILRAETELKTAKMRVAQDKKEFDRLKANLKAHYMKEYGLI